MRSAADIDEVGCPDPATPLTRTESTRSCCPSSCHPCFSSVIRTILCVPEARPQTSGSVQGMDIVAALFVEGIGQRQVPGPSTRFDLTGVMFSLPAPGDLPEIGRA